MAGTTRKRNFTYNHLIALSIIIFLSSIKTITLHNYTFVLFSLIYIIFLSKFSFPTLPPTNQPPVIDPKNKLLRTYVLITEIIGLFLPTAFIIQGVINGDRQGVEAAAPHLFLLASQVVMEGVVFRAGFSLPIFAFVPVLYNSRRIFDLLEWVRMSMDGEDDDGVWGSGMGRRYFGRGLAVANLGLWLFNLFGFLLPVYLPKVFKRYYSGSNNAED